MIKSVSSSKKKRSARLIFVLIYLVLLIVSNLVRWPQGHSARPLPHHQLMTLPTHNGTEFIDDHVEMVYQDINNSGSKAVPTILLLHGSPMRSYGLQKLAVALSKNARVLAPELPGFGRSVRKVPNYSFVAHAAYLEKIIEQLNLDAVHIVVYSQGGGVALELFHRRPDMVKSLGFVSSIGVQEFELLGNYGLNHAIHGLQLGVVRMAEFLIPHFGSLDTLMLNSSYAKNYYESDMRPLRDYLKSYAGPMLIVHGKEDILVPPGAAKETHRLVPQSELVMKDGGHIMVYTDANTIAEEVIPFVQRVEQGKALTKKDASPERIAKADIPFDRSQVDPAVGVAMLVMIVLIALSTLISEDLACIGAGLLATQGIISYWTAATGAFIGIFFGDLLLYWAGYHWGRAALRRAPLRWLIKESSIKDCSRWFARKGPVVVISSRFVPGSRLPTFFTAGVLHTNFWLFVLFFLVASLIWAPLLVWLAMSVGQQIIEKLYEYRLYTIGVISATIVLLWLMFKIIIPMFSFKGRRLLFSRWKKIVRWEYWPSWLFYSPVVVYVLYLGMRYRSLTLFTASNPAIRFSGLIGESKNEILDGLKARGELVARHGMVPASMSHHEKELAVIAFLNENGLSFPVVLKPDFGQRGLGVAIIRNEASLKTYFETPRPLTIVQEYVPGFEFGVFYYRLPGQPRGHVYSITDKRFPSVVGDGMHDLEYLILKDPRAVCMAKHYLRVLEDERYRVPEEDEVVQLVEIGTHCRGTVFQDGHWVKTPALVKTMDELSQGYEGFYFGRYDIRTPSIDDLRAGKGFKVIELNGVTSESTNIYDPNYGLFDAYSILFKQWRIAFKIGDRNRKNGVKPCSVPEFFQALADYDAAPEA